MSYEQMSREGECLLRTAVASGNWFSVIDNLLQLREQMLCERLRMQPDRRKTGRKAYGAMTRAKEGN